MVTFRTDMKAAFQFLLPNHVLAVRTLGEKPLGLDPLLLLNRGLKRGFIPFKPSHLLMIVEKNGKEQLSNFGRETPLEGF
jgi:hypothetical protein